MAVSENATAEENSDDQQGRHEPETGQNLPAIFHRIGGDLERVFRDIGSYVDDRFPIPRGLEIGIAELVREHPELNTEPRISTVVWAFSFHGIGMAQRKEFAELYNDYTPEEIGVALDYLYEAGMRSRGVAARSEDHGLLLVRAALLRIREMSDEGFVEPTPESLDQGDWNILDYIEEVKAQEEYREDS